MKLYHAAARQAGNIYAFKLTVVTIVRVLVDLTAASLSLICIDRLLIVLLAQREPSQHVANVCYAFHADVNLNRRIPNDARHCE
jgi:hypothetical protein